IGRFVLHVVHGAVDFLHQRVLPVRQYLAEMFALGLVHILLTLFRGIWSKILNFWYILRFDAVSHGDFWSLRQRVSLAECSNKSNLYRVRSGCTGDSDQAVLAPTVSAR